MKLEGETEEARLNILVTFCHFCFCLKLIKFVGFVLVSLVVLCVPPLPHSQSTQQRRLQGGGVRPEGRELLHGQRPGL